MTSPYLTTPPYSMVAINSRERDIQTPASRPPIKKTLHLFNLRSKSQVAALCFAPVLSHK